MSVVTKCYTVAYLDVHIDNSKTYRWIDRRGKINLGVNGE